MTTHPDLTTAAAYMDEAMKAIALAKQVLTGGAGGALFVSSGPDLAAAEASPGNPYGSSVPLASLRDREHYDAGSAAKVAEGVEPVSPWTVIKDVPAEDPHNFAGKAITAGTVFYEFHLPTYGAVDSRAGIALSVKPGEYPFFEFPREAVVEGLPSIAPGDYLDGHEDDGPDLCPAQWGEPPETMLCSLASGHDGNHATAEGIEWGGRWETAEPGAKDGAR